MPPAARRDEAGLEIVEWTNGQPHFEGEFIAAYVTIDASRHNLCTTLMLVQCPSSAPPPPGLHSSFDIPNSSFHRPSLP